MAMSNKKAEKMRKIIEQGRARRRHFDQKAKNDRAAIAFNRPVYHLGK